MSMPCSTVPSGGVALSLAIAVQGGEFLRRLKIAIKAELGG